MSTASVEVTWETARDWIRDNSTESREELKRINTEREFSEYLKDGTVLLRLLMHSKRQEIEGIKHGYVVDVCFYLGNNLTSF